MKILITGIGITGKSSFRRLFMNELRSWGLKVEHYDADKFDEIRHPLEIDCLKKLPENFLEKTIYIIEDIHATMDSAVMPLNQYDLIIYLKTGVFSHLMFWLPRMWKWFESGQFSWDQDKGWMGTGKPKDLRNVIPIVKDMMRDFHNRKKWVKKDLEAIKNLPHIITSSCWTRHGIKFTWP
ncbi:hypothetical protein KKB71_03400 [Patescibacteria group bacterium]|nr:hypothetical protein [Patescibacteria group bacterium]